MSLDINNLTVGELYAALRVHGDLILTIPTTEVDSIKARLSQFKTRYGAEDKARRLAYATLRKSEKVLDGIHLIDLQITLKGQDVLPVYDLRKAEDF
jgi:hypothetical protein